MFQKHLSLVFLFMACSFLVVGCSGSSNKGGGGTVSGSAGVDGAESYFLASSSVAASSSLSSPVVSPSISLNGNRFDFDEDGSILYYQTNNGDVKEVFFTLNGVNQRAYVDDVIYAGGGRLLAEIERLFPVAADGTVAPGRGTETDGLYILINAFNGEVKELPSNRMRACGDDIELFEVVGDFGYAVCEDAAYKIDLTSLSAEQIGVSGNDAYDDTAVVVFSDGTVLATKAIGRQSNSSEFLNKTTPVKFNSPMSYEFTKMQNGGDTVNYSNVFVGGKVNTSMNYTQWTAAIAQKSTAGEYYHDQMKFLFGDMKYDEDDGNYELELTNKYTKVLNPVESYNFGTFKDKDNKIYTLSLEDNFTSNVAAQKEFDITFAEIRVLADGTIERDIKSLVTVADASGFSGILWNRKDTTSRHLDKQRAYDAKSFYTIDMETKTVSKTAWDVSDTDLQSLKNAGKGKVYYGTEGIAFIGGSSLKYIIYKDNAEVESANLPDGCGTISNVSLNGKELYYTCNRQTTYMNNLNGQNIQPEVVSQTGKAIGNIIEVKDKRN